MTDIYSRQQLLHLDIPTRVAVVGCGGIGSWVAILSAMSGVQELLLFDPDVMEESNLNRLPFCEGSINRKKVDVVAEYIRAIRPECNVIPVPEKLEGVLIDPIMRMHPVIIECTDSTKSQIMLYSICKESANRFIRAGYDGTRIMVTSVVSGWIKVEEEADYTVAPSWVVPAITVAALAVGKLEKFFAQEVGLDLGEIGIPVLQKPPPRLSVECRRNQSLGARGARPRMPII